MTAARRARKKANRRRAGRHTVADHRPRRPHPYYPGKWLPVNCKICRPVPRVWDRSLAGAAREVK